MPITNGVFSNRYQEQEDYEYHSGAEFFPYIILRETESQEPPIVVEEIEEKNSFFKRVLEMMKIKLFKI